MSVSFGRQLFIGFVLVYGFAAFWLLTTNMKAGRPWWSVAWVLVASPVLILFALLAVQRGQSSTSTFTVFNISYAAVSDLFVITAAVAVLAVGWKRYIDAIGEFWKSPWWFFLAYGMGLAAGWYFHRILGGRADSNSAVLTERLHDSATSWAHNLGVFPALAGALIWAIVPLLFTAGARNWAFVALGLVTMWFGISLVDIWRSSLPTTNRWYFNQQWLDTLMYWPRLRPARG